MGDGQGGRDNTRCLGSHGAAVAGRPQDGGTIQAQAGGEVPRRRSGGNAGRAPKWDWAMKPEQISPDSLGSIEAIRRETLWAIETLKQPSAKPKNTSAIGGFKQAEADAFVAILDRYVALLGRVARQPGNLKWRLS